MGQCITCKNSKVKPSLQYENLNEQLEELRKTTISEIRRLHNLVLECKTEIETCVTQNNKPLAILIKMKQTYIKTKSKTLQELIRNIDEIVPETKNSKRKKEIFNQGNKLVVEFQEPIFSNDLHKLMEGDEEYNKKVVGELNKANLIMSEIEREIEEEFLEKDSSPARLKRRRYSKGNSN